MFWGCIWGSGANQAPVGMRRKSEATGVSRTGRAGCGASWCGQNDVGRKWLADFTGATAPEGVFPYAAWARTLRRVLADESERTVLEAAGPQGSPRLRAAIAAHLRGFRGMEVHPDQIVIGSGAQSLYGLLVQLLAATWYTVWKTPATAACEYLPVERCGGAADRPRRGGTVVGGS